jgi:hypothetical protein
VLVEGTGPEARAAQSRLRQIGYEVCTCDGPSPDQPCPLLQGEECRLVEAAEVVVNALGDLDPQGEIAVATRSVSGAAVLRLGPCAPDDAGAENRRERVERVSAADLVKGLRVALDLTGTPSGAGLDPIHRHSLSTPHVP